MIWIFQKGKLYSGNDSVYKCPLRVIFKVQGDNWTFKELLKTKNSASAHKEICRFLQQKCFK